MEMSEIYKQQDWDATFFGKDLKALFVGTFSTEIKDSSINGSIDIPALNVSNLLLKGKIAVTDTAIIGYMEGDHTVEVKMNMIMWSLQPLGLGPVGSAWIKAPLVHSCFVVARPK